MSHFEIPYYEDYISKPLRDHLLQQAIPVKGVEGLLQVGDNHGLETPRALQFCCELYERIKPSLKEVLENRVKDRSFIDQRVKAYYQFNQEHGIPFTSADYQTVIGDVDADKRIVIGPQRDKFYQADESKKVAEIPEYLKGNHVTLFGPPDSAKLSINAMNAFHRQLKDEPSIIKELVGEFAGVPMWGADDEDSKTPLRSDLVDAGINLKGCLNGDLHLIDEKNKEYKIIPERKSFPIKRFPGLALPCSFLWLNNNPIPLHIYDFALHVFEHWHNPKALVFYVPKLESESEAAYIKLMFETAEKMLQVDHPEYKLGTIRNIIVLENPRAVFRLNEMMDELYPYFLGASLGWHDYLGSTARLFKEDANYRIPVKADPNIVINYIKASHELVTEVVGKRGGIKIGGMYGILPTTTELDSDSFQITLRGFFKDVVTQLKRGLQGFWVAHPDFVRIGIAITQAWKSHERGDSSALSEMISKLLREKYANEIISFIQAEDVKGLDTSDELYARSLIVADLAESEYIANNDPQEVRYNVFQTLQYLTDWLSGNGCVALPALIEGIPVRVMDDLATAERSRWEVWHEIYHGRVSLADFIRIAHEEMNFIRRDLSNDQKIVQVKYSESNAKWYEVAFKLMLKLMTDKQPVEFATELLMPLTLESIRKSDHPWQVLSSIDCAKYSIRPEVERYNYFFEMCGCDRFARTHAKDIYIDEDSIKQTIMSFSQTEIIQAASFHGNIGQSSKSLDAMAKDEQSLVAKESKAIKEKLLQLGEKYLQKFGIKFLISAQGKNSAEILSELEKRLNNTYEQEELNAKLALFEITCKRIKQHPIGSFSDQLKTKFEHAGVKGLQFAVASGPHAIQQVELGNAGEAKVGPNTLFEMASLSKSFASAFSMEVFKEHNISLETPVNKLLEKYGSHFRLQSSLNSDWNEQVKLKHLMAHSALNMHYVNGVPVNEEMPPISEFLVGNEAYGYPSVDIINEPGKTFKYSGAGFIVLEYIVKLILGTEFDNRGKKFFDQLGLKQTSFALYDKSADHALGYDDKLNLIPEKLKQFPLFAAGMYGIAREVTQFLAHMTEAFLKLEGSGGISHDTAIHMLYGQDKGCKEFMSALMGLGIFTIEAGENRFMLHQGANDGFRSIFLYCYQGPDRHKGFTIFANGELNAVFLNANISQMLLRELNIQGIDFDKFLTDFNSQGLVQEEIVNMGYKQLVLDAFCEDLPEAIENRNSYSDLAEFNLVTEAKILRVSNQRFARAENLFSPFEPVFDPKLFGKQGKVMDSWEGARHNQYEYDYLEFELASAANINFVNISTKYHLGNQVEFVSLEAKESHNNWITLIDRFQLDGHSMVKIKLQQNEKKYKQFRLKVYPDGGITRLALYSELPPESAKDFDSIEKAKCHVFTDVIPMTSKPMTIDFSALPKYDYKVKRKNYASALFGAKIESATDEHYAPADSILSPFSPLNMFDGLESKRSRKVDHFEQVIFSLAEEINIAEIVVDFTYFVNNNPMALKIEHATSEGWIELVPLTQVKPYAGNKISFQLRTLKSTKKLKLTILPDGGINRILVYKA